MAWLDHPVAELDRSEFPDALIHPKWQPDKLWVRGSRAVFRDDAVAIVGSRDASDEACFFARQLATSAVRRGLCVISGGARGIDLAAHQGALDAEGRSIVVLGTPIDEPYPSRHGAMFERVLVTGGAWLSEVPLGSHYSPRHFVERNRLIVGLSCAVVVVTAREKSGALITADWAHRWPRPLAVVTGAPWDERSAGTRQWLSRARAISCAEDFAVWLSELGWPARSASSEKPLVTGTLHDWAQRLRMPPKAAAAWLTRGELEGWAYLLGSGRYLVHADAVGARPTEVGDKAASSVRAARP